MEIKDLLENPEIAPKIQELIEQGKQPLLTKRDELLGELKTARQQLEALQLEMEAAKARPEVKEEKTVAQPDPTQLEQLKAMLAEREAELTQVKTQVTQEKINTQVANAIKEARGVYELLEPHIKSRVKYENENLVILDNSGNPMYKNGEPAKLSDLVEEMRTNPIYGRAFEATASGSGARNSATKVNSLITDPADPNYSLSAHMEYVKKQRTKA